jgi:UPF0716 protein FxsA
MMSSLRTTVMLLFLGLPLLEIAVLIQVGQAIGFWPTIGLLILSALLGMTIIRRQGLAMVGRMFEAVSQGRFAFASMIDSYATIAAGCLLIVPGFISDALGLALLIPPLRRSILRAMLPGIAGAGRRSDNPTASPKRAPEAARPIVIEGTYERLDDDGSPKR